MTAWLTRGEFIEQAAIPMLEGMRAHWWTLYQPFDDLGVELHFTTQYAAFVSHIPFMWLVDERIDEIMNVFMKSWEVFMKAAPQHEQLQFLECCFDRNCMLLPDCAKDEL